VFRFTFPTFEGYADVTISPENVITFSDHVQEKIGFASFTDHGLEFLNSIGVPGETYQEGATSFSTFETPIGLAYTGMCLFTCCYGCGLKITSDTSFALKYCEAATKLYKVACYSDDPSRKDRVWIPFADQLQALQECLQFFTSINENRKQALGKRTVSTQQGALFPKTLDCLAQNAKVLTEIFEGLRSDPEYEQQTELQTRTLIEA